SPTGISGKTKAPGSPSPISTVMARRNSWSWRWTTRRNRTVATTASAGGWKRADQRDGWGPWQPIPDWRFWENQGARITVAGLCPHWMPPLVLIAADNPPGQNDGWYRVLDVMTDLDMAAQMGVWRLLENDSQVNPVHAALLHTGSVLFFAGSGNDQDRHSALQYATAVWHYPQ